MPPTKRQDNAEKPKRQRKRKARTEVSSSSESDSSDESDVQTKKPKMVVKTQSKKKAQPEGVSTPDDQESNDSTTPPSARQVADAEAEDAFTSFYLRQITTEFSEDLDKIRSAGDFNDKSLGLLIGALKQGCDCFQRDERISVGKAIALAKA